MTLETASGKAVSGHLVQPASDVVEILNPFGKSPYVLLCEHASAFIPSSYAFLGLPECERLRHIAWDIGARAVAVELSRQLDAVLVLGKVSRLVIDLNRPLHSTSSIPSVSEMTVIPGNERLSEAQRRERQERWFHPFHDAVASLLDRRQIAGEKTFLLGIHSFTPVFKGETRAWPAGILFDRAITYAEAFIQALKDTSGGPVVGNFPYVIEQDEDYAVPVHGDGRNIPACLVEIRQDLLLDEKQTHQWASWLAQAARKVESSENLLVLKPAL
ncbi:N-formylglutamate amidohydrolase [Gluconobacter kanchanaburiensis]|uniref:N-formylglutamate amidohydrolase n=1 Tax=Gluconobacter kanchanaburiensis NBRC 103587 TaxID=1307948 RepID=A0A511B813_9PROT|nr:N-formylglutamate amidohydrolase [Gluconobacter kanchanaburiensis]MBF0862395.1 N-formylglutamate amidohydrolase [Gluconobacter kanchanaburiensis]GBR68726.1 N-formylglutamate amidohydrolase [Gluconobacter kanchanaburiensis NBRC 103587]GEK96484.1 N-formylglutamate amidohydrolase [Gluconobacter kanchanaburiensis NBRC 103587]